ncbi:MULTISPECIES: hypothetical protein [unclassified Actinotignum]|uniref:hypothetical protein n=1 Tax=unclassified Actinotignum TaxID=2632702 RepID=UPI002A8391E4|nr:hypothetical protein [Actinotignum sp. SLA_B059]MDY5127472.1 hypothetical protein [Actinotignum sp. SLA_B059]
MARFEFVEVTPANGIVEDVLAETAEGAREEFARYIDGYRVEEIDKNYMARRSDERARVACFECYDPETATTWYMAIEEILDLND